MTAFLRDSFTDTVPCTYASGPPCAVWSNGEFTSGRFRISDADRLRLNADRLPDDPPYRVIFSIGRFRLIKAVQ